MEEILPSNICELLQSYLKDRNYRVAYEDARSKFHKIEAGIPQGSVLGLTLYLLYTADIPKTSKTTFAIFADDTAIMAVDDSQSEATRKLQKALDTVTEWMNRWKIRINEKKSVHVTFTLRQRNSHHCVYANGIQIPQADTARYLGLHLDVKLNWKHHVRMKAQQMRLKLRKMYWLIGPHSSLSLCNKVIIYKTIIRPIWTYGAQLWGCAIQSNRMVIQRSQNKFLRAAVNAFRYTRNEDIHRDFGIKTVDDIIQEIAGGREKRLHRHDNVLALLLFEDCSKDKRRLKRLKPYELV